MLSCKAVFPLSSFTLIRRLCSYLSLSVIRVVSSAFLKLLIFPPENLIPACESSSLAFCMLYLYSAYKLSKQDDNIQPCHTPFPIWNQSVVLCPVLTASSWPTYRFLRRQVRWPGTPITLRIFHKFVVMHTVNSFSIVCETDIDAFRTPLLSPWFNKCWQFALSFVCLFETQFVQLEVLSSCTTEV